MAEVRLKAVKRDGNGKGVARRSRAAGNVPGVVYGHGMEPLSIEVDRREFVTALLTDAGMNVLLDLEIDGDTTLALTKELQRDPVRGTLLHADFVKIDRTQEVDVDVPVLLVGESPGAAQGGVLEHSTASLQIRSLATEVPEQLEVDISALEVGDSIRVGDLSGKTSYTILSDPDTMVVSVTAPISEEELEAIEASAGVVQEESDAAVEAAAEAAEAAEAGEGDEAPAGGEEETS